MKKNNTNWRVNVVVLFMFKELTHLNRTRLQTMLSYYAWLYKLDYAISEKHQDWHEPDFDFDEFSQESEADIVFFRATSQTPLSAAEFRKVLKLTFAHSLSMCAQGIEVSTQLQKNLKAYPFPRDYKIWGQSF